MRLVWPTNAWPDYVCWQSQDRKILRRINLLLDDIVGSGHDGPGKPEPLRHDFRGYWFLRIHDEHRLIYRIVDQDVLVAACRHHHR